MIKIKLNYNIIDINTEFVYKNIKVSITSDATLWAEPWLLKKEWADRTETWKFLLEILRVASVESTRNS